MKAKKKKLKLSGRVNHWLNDSTITNANNRNPGTYRKPGSQK